MNPDKNSPEFIAFIRHVLGNFGRLSEDKIGVITAPEHHAEWRKAFTTKYEDPSENYEIYEFLGDASMTPAFLFYLRKKYSQLFSTGLLTASAARLKINYLDVETFSRFSNQYGFSQWVIPPNEEAMSENELKKYQSKHGIQGVHEDILESFYGVTEKLIDDYILSGLGTTIIRNMLAHMYENSVDVTFDFRYTTLFDAKTRLKQAVDFIFQRDFQTNPPDKRRRAIFYTMDPDPETGAPSLTLEVAFPTKIGGDHIGERHHLVTISTGERQKVIEKKAAEIGLQIIAKSGYSMPNPPNINTEIEKLFYHDIEPNSTASFYVRTEEETKRIPSISEIVGQQRQFSPSHQQRPQGQQRQYSPRPQGQQHQPYNPPQRRERQEWSGSSHEQPWRGSSTRATPPTGAPSSARPSTGTPPARPSSSGASSRRSSSAIRDALRRKQKQKQKK